ncbi:hypothetical protein AB0E59_22450 [Lentzea sp. NPDC034063]|uniref:hypothetical protein n=1 Tax=unclassified Lentzea TaxID=2643253 RepID=UPI003405305A
MTVDLWATMHTPISLEELVTGARDTTGRLLGIDDPPAVHVFADPQWGDAGLVYAGRRLDSAEQRSLVVAEHDRDAPADRSSRRWFRFTTSAGGSAVAVAFDHVEPSFGPERTCAGVVVATALALTAAERGGGEFVDITIFMLEPPEPSPQRVVELTRLPDRGPDFGPRCERYLRQFAGLDGWPPAVLT